MTLTKPNLPPPSRKDIELTSELAAATEKGPSWSDALAMPGATETVGPNGERRVSLNGNKAGLRALWESTQKRRAAEIEVGQKMQQRERRVKLYDREGRERPVREADAERLIRRKGFTEHRGGARTFGWSRAYAEAAYWKRKDHQGAWWEKGDDG